MVIEICENPRKTYNDGKAPLWLCFQMRAGNEKGRGMAGKIFLHPKVSAHSRSINYDLARLHYS